MLERLPSEIVRQIVSSFTRLDFITCAQVNRAWRQHLPPYSAHLWERIHIKTNDHLVFLADTACFGQYITSCTITMHNDDTLPFLALERLRGCHLQSLALDSFNVKDNKRLADLLRNIKSESLAFTGVTGACLDFIGIIAAAASDIRHFACHYDGLCPSFMFGNHPPPPSLNTNHFGLVSLALTTQNLVIDWMDILQRCSATLQHLHIGPSIPTISCQDIMETCPRLQSMFIGEFSIPRMLIWPPSSSDKPGLRYLCHWGACYDVDAMKFIIRHQHTLEYLYLDTWVPVLQQPWHDLDSFQSNTLKTLECINMHDCTPSTLVSLIRQSPNLDTVVLLPVGPIPDQIWHALMSLDTLRHLSIHLELPKHQHHNQEWHTIIRPLGAMTTLRQLELQGLNGANSNQCCQLFQLLHDIPLVKLHLSHIRALDDMALAALVHIKSLEEINITNCTLVTTRGIKTLIDGLPKLRNMTFSLFHAQRMPPGVDELVTYAKSSRGVKLIVNRCN